MLGTNFVRNQSLIELTQISRGSANGKLLAFGSSDYTIGVLDANTLAVRHLGSTAELFSQAYPSP
jgi:hypothetical protein